MELHGKDIPLQRQDGVTKYADLSIMQFTKFPSIEQFRHTVGKVEKMCSEETCPKPSVEFTGTVKLHGTNGGVGFNGTSFLIQSRNREITVSADNCGFANFITENKALSSVLDIIYNEHCDDGDQIFIYGEWCGKGVQKGVAVAELEKMFVIFNVMISGSSVSVTEILQDHTSTLNDARIYHIYQFTTWKLTVDFSSPSDSMDQLTKITNQVEKRCPVGTYFNVEGTGEGVVWSGLYMDEILRFKVKGEEHSVVKTKNRVTISPEKQKSIQDFVDFSVTENRLQQGFNEIEIKSIGCLIKWVVDDIQKEELDTMIASDLSINEVKKSIASAVKSWFQTKC